MRNIEIAKINSLRGEIIIPGDKSISHRAVIISSIASGITKIHNFLKAEDCMNTVKAFQSMGVNIYFTEKTLIVEGKGLYGLKEPQDILDFGNSGTSLRLISGILAGQNFLSVITGDMSLRQRPLKRIIEPLQKMGTTIFAKDNNNFLPLVIKGGKLNSITYRLPIPSAQVKSCILLAGLFANGETKVIEPIKSRDHTEKMLKFFGAEITENSLEIAIQGRKNLKGKEIIIPSDISSAAFFIVAATILKKSSLIIKNIGLNETRTGILTVLRQMGANITIENEKIVNNEKIGDLVIKSSKLHGIELKGSIIPNIIDEIPILCVAASLAKGKTIIKDAKELRVKESDRIKSIVTNLRILGVEVEEFEDGMIITGVKEFNGNNVCSFGDHRIAMAMIIAGFQNKKSLLVQDIDCINTSFPEFLEILEQVKN